jgi:mannose-6-phosphate isomerase-like protein (cupin superfamily)
MTLSTHPATTFEGARGRTWWSLGLVVTELSSGADGTLVVAEAVLPEGASPPLHVHEYLDDSFYLLSGTMVLRCGEEVSIAEPGDWVPFPQGVPHTFRVIGGPARVLMVHANNSFLAAVRELGRPAESAELPPPTEGPSFETLSSVLAAHGVATIGPSMEDEEARNLVAMLAPR